MAANILVNEKTVEDGLVELEKVSAYIKNAETAVANLKSSVPTYVSVPGFPMAESLLSAAISNCIEIIDKCNEYVEISKGIDDCIINSIAPVLNLNVQNGLQLTQKGAPYNPNLLEDYRNALLEKNSDLRNELITQAFTDYKSMLTSQGISETDADRVLNGEITIEQLYDEIANDSNRDRYQAWLEAQYLLGCAYSYSESNDKLEALNQTKNQLENELADVNSKIRDYEAEFSRRKVPENGQNISQLYNERSNLENALKETNKEIIETTLLIESHGEVDINFKTMGELSSALDMCYNSITLLTAELRQAKKEMYEAVSYDKFIFELASSQSIESALETIVAFSYTDEDGYVYYSFDLTEVSSNMKDIKYITYKDLYGDSLATKKTIEMLSSGDEDGDISIKTYEAQQYVLDNYDDFFQGNEFDSSRVDEINEELTKKIREKNIYLSIQSNINENVNFYLTNIDKYMIKDDFEVNCKFKGDYSTTASEYVIGAKDDLDVEEYTARAIYFLVNDFETDNNGNRTYNVNMKNNANNAVALSTGDYINVEYFNKSVHYENGTNPTNYSEMVKNYSTLWRELMTDDEIAAFNYVCNVFGYSAGYSFLESITPTLDKRYNQNLQSKDEEFAYEHPFLASLGSIFVKPIEGIGGFGYSINCLANGVDMQRSRLYSHADTWRGTVSTNIRILSGDTASFFYNTAMSIGDSGLVILLTTATGGGSLIFSTSVMGSSVYLTVLNDALDRNISPTKAVLLALTSASIESLMESKSVAHLVGLEKEFNLVLGSGGIVDKIIEKLTRAGINSDVATKMVAMGYCILNQSLVEGDEEFWTESLDYLVDWVISGDLSKRELNINKYREEHPGCSDSEAYFYEYQNHIKDLEMAWLGGAVSGTFFGFGAGAKYTFGSNYSKMMLVNFLNNKINELQINTKIQDSNANGTTISSNKQTSTNANSIVEQFNIDLNDKAKVINVNENNEAIIETKYGDKISVPIEQLNSANTIYVVERLNRIFEIKESLQYKLTDDNKRNSNFFEIPTEYLNELNIRAFNEGFKYSYYYVADGNNGFRIVRIIKKGGVSLATLNRDGVSIDSNAFFYGDGRYTIDEDGTITDTVTGFKSVITPTIDKETEKHIFGYVIATDGRSSFKGGHTHAILTMPGVTVNNIQHFSNGVDVCNITIEVDGKKYTKTTTTMFPEDWSNETIISAIKEVIKGKPFNFQINGNIAYRGIFEGVEMLVIVKPSGRVDTAYPINPNDTKSGYNILSLGDFLGNKILTNDTNTEVNVPNTNNDNGNNIDLTDFYKKIPEFFVRGATSLSGLYAFCMELSQMNGFSFEEYMQQKLAVGDFSDIELFKKLYPYLQSLSKFLSNRSMSRVMDNIQTSIWNNNMVILDSWQELFAKYPSVYEYIIKNRGIFEYNGEIYPSASDLRSDLNSGKIESTEELEFAYKIMKYYELTFGDSLFMINESNINSLNDRLNSMKSELEKLYARLNDANNSADRESIAADIRMYEYEINQTNNEIMETTEELTFKEKYIEAYLNIILNDLIPNIKNKLSKKFTGDEADNIIKLLDNYINNWFTLSAMQTNVFDPLSRMAQILDSFRNTSFDEYISKLNNAIETVRIIPTVLNLFNNSQDQSLQTLLNLIRKELMNIPTDSDHGEVDDKYRTHNLMEINKFFENTIEYQYIEKYMNMLSDDFDKLKTIENTDEYIRQIGIMWYKFMLIHPYSDGNGRTGRILLNVLFEQRNISVPSLFNTENEQSNFLKKLDTYMENGKIDTDGLGDAFLEYVKNLINSTNSDTAVQTNSSSPMNLDSDDENIVVQNQIIDLLISNEFNNADFDKQMKMISEVPGYDSLPTETKVSIYIMLLEIVAEEKGLDLKKLSELTGEGIISQDILDNAKQYAENISDKAKQSEPAIRKVLQGFEDNDCILIGLEKSLKTEESITRKILFDMNNSHMEMKDAADAIGDSVRFTYIIDPNNYTQKTIELLGKIRDSGYEIIKIKNTWDSATYKGVNVSLKASDGTIFEVQFHTTDSFIVKECDNHLYYEIRRNENVTKYDRALADEIQKLFTSTILIPEGILEINLNKEFNVPETVIIQNNNVDVSSSGISDAIRKGFNAINLRKVISNPSQIALNDALNNGLKNSNILFDETTISNMKDVLQSLDLNGISPELINKFITNDGFDFANFLEYSIRNNLLSDSDINKLKNLDDYKQIMLNPESSLLSIHTRLVKIIDLVNRYGWNAFFTESFYNDSLYNYYSFLAYFVSRDYNFRKANRDALLDIANKLAAIETAYINLKYINKFSYKGMEINVFGDNQEFLSTAARRLMEVIDKLPSFLLKQYTLLNSFNIYDTVAAGDLLSFFENEQYFNNPNEHFFMAGGDYSSNKNAIRLFKWDFEKKDDTGLLGTIFHELAHALDYAIGIMTGNTQYLSETTKLWQDAKDKDGVSVSAYGNSDISEDFAETVRIYSQAALGMTTTSFEEFRKKYFNRVQILEAIITLRNRDVNSQILKIDDRIQILNAFGDNLTYKVCELLYGSDFLKQLGYKPFNVKYKIASFNKSMGLNNFIVELMSNPESTYLNNLDVNSIISLIDLYLYDEYRDKIVYKLFENKFKTVNSRCIDELMKLNTSSDREKSLIKDICTELINSNGTTISVFKYLSSTSDISAQMFSNVMNILIRYSRR